MLRTTTTLAASLVVVVAAGLMMTPSVRAQQGPPSGSRRADCESIISQDAVNPVLARHRDRLQAARENMIREERALGALLVAENTIRAALDAQMVKSTDAQNAYARARLDFLWDLRPVIPAQNRERAFRCAFLLMRQR